MILRITLIVSIFLSQFLPSQRLNFNQTKDGDILPFPKDSILNLKYDKFIEFTTTKKSKSFDDSYSGEYNQQFLTDFPVEFRELYDKGFNYLKFDKVGDTTYGLALNSLGFWLVANENNQTIPYFLGIAKDRFIHVKISENYPLIKKNQLQLECSIIRQINPESFPQIIPEDFAKYEALQDNLLIKINLKTLKNDSDNDGYNDIFENYVGLNPFSKDSDNDDVSDFEDNNPLYKSIDNEYTIPFNKLMNGGFLHKFNRQDVNSVSIKEKEQSNHPYNFEIFLIKDDALKNINPTSKKVLIFKPENLHKLNFNVSDYSYKNIKKLGENEFEIISSFDLGSTRTKMVKEDDMWVGYLVGGTSH